MTYGGIFNGPTALGTYLVSTRRRAFGAVDTVCLKQGMRYRCRIIIKHTCGAVKADAFTSGRGVEAHIKYKFEHPDKGKPGFTDVQVWMSPGALPADWPESKKAFQIASGYCPAWLEGTWPHADISEPNEGDEDASLLDYWLRDDASAQSPSCDSGSGTEPPPTPPQTTDDTAYWDCVLKCDTDACATECEKLKTVAPPTPPTPPTPPDGEKPPSVEAPPSSGGWQKYVLPVLVVAGVAVFGYVMLGDEAIANKRRRSGGPSGSLYEVIAQAGGRRWVYELSAKSHNAARQAVARRHPNAEMVIFRRRGARGRKIGLRLVESGKAFDPGRTAMPTMVYRERGGRTREEW